MKIGDMIKNEFYSGLERYGVVIEIYDRYVGALPTLKKYCKVKYLPHPEIPFNNGDMYIEYTCEDNMTVVSSV
jgi:hypothetical protein